ncbi:hypothetical protein Micbo1qcDRAFT_207478 [Microdochium bolleyi]|uniref:Hydrophobic surface binding protein A-domain-containing protein n=1 Tax=Microdochium bolleyi TaxID=196109 RepID=A0A136ITK4_9PEZI|nr:hypothetical protein Micbo1qcDRAFT_207478 [Microdochium bolleyi]
MHFKFASSAGLLLVGTLVAATPLQTRQLDITLPGEEFITLFEPISILTSLILGLVLQPDNILVLLFRIPYILQNLDQLNVGLGGVIEAVSLVPVGLPVEAQEQFCAAMQPIIDAENNLATAINDFVARVPIAGIPVRGAFTNVQNTFNDILEELDEKLPACGGLV